MRVLCLYLPLWPIQRLLVADRGLDPNRPLILCRSDARRGQVVTCCNRAAVKRGVRLSMTVADAASRSGDECQILPANSTADLAALARLAEHCERYSSFVGWETIDEAPAEPDRLFLDITGTAALFGGEAALVAELVNDLGQQGYSPRVAVADTIGAAWAQAVYAQPLPVAALRLPIETVELLAQLGVTQIEQLLRLPKTSLLARFGEQLGKRLAQILGDTTETIVAHRPPPEFIVERELEHPEERQEAVEQLVRELIDRLAAQLAKRRQGAMRLACRLYTPAPSIVQLGLFRPSANPHHLWDLLKLQLKPPGPVGRVVLAAMLTAPLENRQGELFSGGRQQTDRQFGLLIDRLCSRLGTSAVVRAERTADPLPERAIAYVPLLESGKRKERPPQTHRPLNLIAPPRRLEVISIAPDGPPISFPWNGQPNKILHWWGPERIEAGWWRGPTVRRDYYAVEVESGERYWLFRRLADGKWFLHGEFT